MTKNKASQNSKKNPRKKYINQDAREMLQDPQLRSVERTALEILIEKESFFSDKEIIPKTLIIQLRNMGHWNAEEIIKYWKEQDFLLENSKLRFRTIKCKKCQKFVSKWAHQRICYICQTEFCDQCESPTPRGIPLKISKSFTQKVIDELWVCEKCFDLIKAKPRILPSEIVSQDFPITRYHMIAPLYIHYSHQENSQSYTNKHDFCTIHFPNGNLIPSFSVISKESIQVNPEFEMDLDARFTKDLMRGIMEGEFGIPKMDLWVMECGDSRERSFQLFASEPNENELRYLIGKNVPVCQECDTMILESNIKKQNCIYCGKELRIIYRENKYFQVQLPLKPHHIPLSFFVRALYIEIGQAFFYLPVDFNIFLSSFQKSLPNNQFGPFLMYFPNDEIDFALIPPENIEQNCLLPEDLIPD